MQNFNLSDFLYGDWGMSGYMDSEGWHYFGHHKEMENLFWRMLEDEIGVGNLSEEDWKRVKLARTIGIIMRYGFQWDSAVGLKPISEDDSSFKYLIAFFKLND